MTVVVELETEHGGRVCFNPRHIVSVLGVADAERPLSVVADLSGAKWRVLGQMHDVAALLFAEAINGGPERLARTASLGQPMLKTRVPAGIPEVSFVDLDGACNVIRS